LRTGQSGLFLADRWDGSMGRSVTPLTRENASQTRHVVGVGIPSHNLHCARPRQRPASSTESRRLAQTHLAVVKRSRPPTYAGLVPTTMESGPASGSTYVCSKPMSVIHDWQSAPVKSKPAWVSINML